MRLIDKDALLAEYDRIHVGAAGRVRKLIEDAPEVFPYTDAEIQNMQGMQSAEVEKAFRLGREDVMDTSAQPEQIFTKAKYIMSLHKEYGCDFIEAEKAHEKALEYLQSKAMMIG